ncbi:hypothetical protein ATZ33_06805 [Enterococcus silesiacus]|uniref:Lipoprotein n=1 Tax=Enterococcus silesiacus TaxID=332949 RepID=A0A0S3KA29_9ENTE|nr:hypothetical protein [Enterococcus silesiacus]ALS01086.1 hypothetical protein ATZ33_06805 [Enterococcus silesiacus]OJG91683.1 hypothetical protein RV15_GL000350 [Enterococcus silesiacus]
MKKIMMLITILLFTAGCTKQTTDSTKKTSDSSTTAISSTSVSSSSASAAPTSTEKPVEATVPSEPAKETTEQSVSVSEQPSDTTPQSLRGTWVGNNGEQDLEVTITANSIITNGQTYKITSYTESNNTFTLLWDTTDMVSSGNPQPFIYTYVPETDGMTNGLDFHRK